MPANIIVQNKVQQKASAAVHALVPTPPYSSSAGGELQGWSPELQEAAAGLLKKTKKSPLLSIIRC